MSPRLTPGALPPWETHLQEVRADVRDHYLPVGAQWPNPRHEHGGSGLGASLSEVLAMTTADRDWFLERIGHQRSREAKEIEKAGKRRS